MQTKIRSVVFYVALYVTVALYFYSLILPGFMQTNEVGQVITSTGVQVLMMGWLGIFAGVFCWYGYALGLVSFFLLHIKSFKWAFILSVVGLIMGLQAIYLQETNAQINFLDSYNTWDRGMGQLASGYYLWLLALGLLVVQSAIAYMLNTRQKHNSNPVDKMTLTSE